MQDLCQYADLCQVRFFGLGLHADLYHAFSLCKTRASMQDLCQKSELCKTRANSEIFRKCPLIYRLSSFIDDEFVRKI